MSKKINIMADVDQLVYDVVVVPHKQSRTFTTLIETLLNGYYKDAYIRSYVDDTIDGIQHESNDVLNDIISSMHKGLANMGVYTEELKSNSKDGMDAFNQKAEETKKEIEELQSQELKLVKETVEELKSQNAEIMGMLKAFMSGSQTAQVQVSSVSHPQVDVPTPISSVVSEVTVEESFGLYDMEESKSETVNVVEDDSEEETSEEEAMNIMANLLVGQEYSF